MYEIEMNHEIEGLFVVNPIRLGEPMNHQLCFMMDIFLVVIEIAPLL